MNDSNPAIIRLKADLQTVQSALGHDRLPFNRTDVWFCAGAALALVPVLAGQIFFQLRGLPLLFSALPFALDLLGYFVYMALKGRRGSSTEPVRKTEYRLAVITTAATALSVFAITRWAGFSGVDLRIIQGVLVATLGAALICLAFLPYQSSRRYRQVSLVFGGIMLAGIGLALPYFSNDNRFLIVSVWGLAVLGGNAAIMEIFLRRQENESAGISDAASSSGE